MHADAAYVMGMGHRVCQDYARAGREGSYLGTGQPMAYGLVADGCSGSPDTDVGARLLVLHAERRLRVGRSLDPDVLGRAAAMCRGEEFPQLHPQALDATLLAVSTGLDGWVRVTVVGDGAFAARDGAGAIRCWAVEAPDGFPRYANYANDARRQAVVEAGEPWTVRGPDGPEFEGGRVQAFTRHFVGVGRGEVGPDGEEVVAVFSDGVRSFVDAERRPIAEAEVVRELMAFKGYQGAFVQRRLHAFLKAAARRGWRHDDDVAMAAVYLGAEVAQ